MKNLPTQDRARKKRQALIDAAIVEFSSIGFETSTAKSIALTAQVATGTFYQYFENKNDILREIAECRYQGLHQQIKTYELHSTDDTQLNTPILEAKFLETLNFVYRFHAQNPELHQVLEQRRSLDEKLQLIMDQGEALLHCRVKEFVQTFNLSNSEQIAENLFAMAEGLVHRLVFHSTGGNAGDRLALGAKMLSSYFLYNQTMN
jgi:AcrR family transcriptional regulator